MAGCRFYITEDVESYMPCPYSRNIRQYQSHLIASPQNLQDGYLDKPAEQSSRHSVVSFEAIQIIVPQKLHHTDM
jgi:hypothetical protein